MAKITSLIVGLLTLSYPFLVYFGVTRQRLQSLALLIVGLGLGRLLSARLQPGQLRLFMPLAFAMVGLGVLVLVTRDMGFFLYYPIVVNLILFSVFYLSLFHPPPMIERFARITQPDLPQQAIAYCATVTKVWCGFFVLNGLIAAGTVWWGDVSIWTLYNGLLSYFLAGALFAIEYLIRRRLQRQFAADLATGKPALPGTDTGVNINS